MSFVDRLADRLDVLAGVDAVTAVQAAEIERLEAELDAIVLEVAEQNYCTPAKARDWLESQVEREAHGERS